MNTHGCVSCTLALTASDDLFVSGCGHVFHKNCLLHVLEHSNKRCPRCYNICNLSDALRLYMPFSNDTPEDSILNTVSQLKRMKLEYYNQRTALSDMQKEHLRILHLQQIKNYYKQKLPELEMLRKEKEKTEKRINKLMKLHLIQTVLSGSPNDVDEILNLNLSPELLATMLVILRRDVKNVGDNKKEHRGELRESQSETEKMNSIVSKLHDKAEMLVAENYQLQSELKSSIAPDSESQHI